MPSQDAARHQYMCTSHTQAAALADAQQRVFGGALAYAVVRRWGDVERYPHCPMVDTRRRPLTSARSSSQTRLKAAPPAVADSGPQSSPRLRPSSATQPLSHASPGWPAKEWALFSTQALPRGLLARRLRGGELGGARAAAAAAAGRHGRAAHAARHPVGGAPRRVQQGGAQPLTSARSLAPTGPHSGRARPGQPQASATSSASQAGMGKLIGPATKWALFRHIHYRRATPSPSAWRGCSDTSARRRSAIGCCSGRCFYPSPTPPMPAWMHAPFPSMLSCGDRAGCCGCPGRNSSGPTRRGTC